MIPSFHFFLGSFFWKMSVLTLDISLLLYTVQVMDVTWVIYTMLTSKSWVGAGGMDIFLSLTIVIDVCQWTRYGSLFKTWSFEGQSVPCSNGQIIMVSSLMTDHELALNFLLITPATFYLVSKWKEHFR